MPQMSPYSWVNLLILSNLMLTMLKMNLFFEKKY
uniref:ATP synthase F0 subunit 8 n=1 Tax=Changeondelphax velitchkovskyi TaxID=1291384 RepID=A0A343UJB6_9HEMI|nr:ATP synthase F0 subunit 8 [Changeondelphax velitchkovskyi]AVC55494.1 ATP synthase F0 subunit 8 [Changeondelphax velitchkovskyi]